MLTFIIWCRAKFTPKTGSCSWNFLFIFSGIHPTSETRWVGFWVLRISTGNWAIRDYRECRYVEYCYGQWHIFVLFVFLRWWSWDLNSELDGSSYNWSFSGDLLFWVLEYGTIVNINLNCSVFTEYLLKFIWVAQTKIIWNLLLRFKYSITLQHKSKQTKDNSSLNIPHITNNLCPCTSTS